MIQEACQLRETSGDAGFPPRASREAGKICRRRQKLPAVSAALGIFFPLVAGVAGAAAELLLPLACQPGRDCWAVRYVDRDPGPRWRDYRGGRRSEEGHDGTDLAIADRKRMAEGVAVLAAAAGTVLRSRDGEPDFAFLEEGAEAIEERRCGNGVLIRHDDGLETQYCHLRRGSVLVRPGDRVPAGAVLGYVGMSGETSFPHLHFTIRDDGRPLDPFEPAGKRTAAWRPEVAAKFAYPPAVLTGIGIAVGPVEGRDLEAGFHDFRRLPVTAPALVVWVRGYWFEAGDRLELSIEAPGGDTLFSDRRRLERSRSFAFYFAGKRRPAEGWRPGTYRLRAVLRRGDREIAVERDLVLFLDGPQ